MASYNHVFSIAFTVISETPDGSDVTAEMLSTAAQKRIANLNDSSDSNDWIEAAGAPEDTYQV